MDTSVTATTTIPANYLFMFRFQAVGTGNVVTFKIKASAAGNVKVAIYADNASAPGALLNAVNTSTPVVAGWNDITIALTSVTSGTYYWLAFSASAAIGYTQTTGGTARYKTVTYSSFTFPNPAGTGYTSNAYNGLVVGWGIIIPPAPPPIPIYSGAITFKWNSSARATKYYLEINTSPTFDGTSIFDGEVGNVTSKNVTGFTLGVIYYWRVKAGNLAHYWIVKRGCSNRTIEY